MNTKTIQINVGVGTNYHYLHWKTTKSLLIFFLDCNQTEAIQNLSSQNSSAPDC